MESVYLIISTEILPFNSIIKDNKKIIGVIKLYFKIYTTCLPCIFGDNGNDNSSMNELMLYTF